MSLTEKINDIIGNKEDFNLAYIQIPPSSNDLAILISSFANTEGGIIILGVATKSNGIIEVKGLSAEFKTKSIFEKSLDLIIPKVDVIFKQTTYNGKILFIIETKKSKIPLLVNSIKYIRIKNKTKPEIKNEFRDAPLRKKTAWEKDRGRFLAIIIGVSNYANHKELNQPIEDAKILKNILEANYSFNPITLLLDPTRNEIIDAFDDLYVEIQEGDNLLIFYAGHGKWEEEIKMGYWLPVDAEKNRRKNWIENSIIHNYCKRFKKCQHIILIVDSCFSGTFTEDMRSTSLEDANKAIQEQYQSKSRIVMTSGWKEKVPDKSVFFEQISQYLFENQERFLSSLTLFQKIRDNVIISTSNNHKPQKERMLNAGHDGGDFIFIKSKD